MLFRSSTQRFSKQRTQHQPGPVQPCCLATQHLMAERKPLWSLPCASKSRIVDRALFPRRASLPSSTPSKYSDNMALDSFKVDWSTEVRQSFFQDFSDRDQVPDSPIKHLFAWHETSSRGRIRHIGLRFKHLFFSTLNLPDEYEWKFERPMGKGSFGAVALFSKMNERQERTDVRAPIHLSPIRI